jgi:hypothetical protein
LRSIAQTTTINNRSGVTQTGAGPGRSRRDECVRHEGSRRRAPCRAIAFAQEQSRQPGQSRRPRGVPQSPCLEPRSGRGGLRSRRRRSQKGSATARRSSSTPLRAMVAAGGMARVAHTVFACFSHSRGVYETPRIGDRQL